MANNYQSINNGREIIRISYELRQAYNKSISIANRMPEGYNTSETRLVVNSMDSIGKEMASICKELEDLGNSIIKVAEELNNEKR